MTLRNHLLLFSFLLPVLFVRAETVVVGYYPMWMESLLPVETIEYESLTHILYAFAWPQANGSLATYSEFNGLDLVDAAEAEDVRVLISVGGWGHGEHFPAVLADSVLRNELVESLVDFCDLYGFSGVDLDWEYPGSAQERDNLSRFVGELRQAFDLVDDQWLITMAVPATSWNGQWYDFTELKNHVDWFGCMTYDFFGSWTSRAGHNSPLYSPQVNNNGSFDSGFHYLNVTRQIPKEQIVLGIPFYGRGCQASGLNEVNGGDNREFAFSDVQTLINTGWSRQWDEACQVPYLLNADASYFISYDDEESIAQKCNYILQKSNRGAMIWSLGQDMIDNQQVLMETVGDALLSGSGIADSQSAVSDGFILAANTPNPFNPYTLFRFHLSGECRVEMRIFNLKGQMIESCNLGRRGPGWHTFHWDAQKEAAGLYVARFRAGSSWKCQKITLMK